MGSKIRRVPLNFDWPLNKVWKGYMNPYGNTCPDCKGRTVEPIYTCDIRLLSDNADFHLEKGWTALLQNDLEQALRIQSKIVPKQKLSEKILKVLNHD